MRAKRPRTAKTPPPGLIVVISGELSRYTVFNQSLVHLMTPPGTRIGWARGVNIAGNLNHALEDLYGEWVWLMGDDHIFAPDILLRLLSHEVDLVCPVVVMRQAPFPPIVFKADNPDGTFQFWKGTELPAGGLHEVAAGAGAGLLIRRHVLEAMDRPYFEIGQLKSTEMSEDLVFQRKARAKGFRVYVDFDTTMGHITPAGLWAEKEADGRWAIRVDPECRIPGVAV